MEEIEYKLKQNNAILIVQAISKLVEIIKSKKSNIESNDKNASDFNISELQLLKTKCGVEDPIVSITASHGIVSLVEDGVLSVEATLSDLMVILTTAKFYTGITNAIGNLLLLDLRSSLELNSSYTCPFQIQKSQHPLITVLSQNQDIWLEIFNQIQLFINHYDDKISNNSIELLRPVFFYILCDPCSKLRDTSRRQLWSLLTLKDEHLQIRLIIFEIISWIQISSRSKCLELRDFLIETSKFVVKSGNTEICTSIILYLTTLIHRLVKFGCDPTSNILAIIELLKLQPSYETHSIILVILAEIITSSPPMYLSEILRLCHIIVLHQAANVLSVKSVVSSILQWLLYPSDLLLDTLKHANDIISFTENNNTYGAFTGNLYRDIYFKYIQYADSNLDLAVKLCLLSDKLQTEEKYLLNWLEEVALSPIRFLQKNFSFISGIFIHKFNDASIIRKALQILLTLVKNKPELSFNVLVLILHKLSNEKDSQTNVELLKAIPLMAVSKQNIPLIVSTFEIIKNGPIALKTLSFKLFLQLWSVEVRCFPYLQKLLLENDDNWEFGIAKAHTLKEICFQRSDLHGKEMVVHLSQILNKYVDQKGSIASSLALEGITILCQNEIVDIVSTWRGISPKFIKDKRPRVIKSLCEFFSEFSNLQSSLENDALINEIICKLWSYVTSNENVEIISAALKALSCFNIEQMTLKQLPDCYKQKLKLPAQYAKTPVDAARKPEDVLPYIPGECWVQLVQNTNYEASEAVVDLLIRWTRMEIAGYRGGVYKIRDDKGEPKNYDSLPEKSIVRALSNYIRLVIMPGSKYVYSEYSVTQSLQILGEAYSKPLPPMDWNFLLDLFEKGEKVKQLCINLLCKQVLVSISARMIIENFINEFQPNIEKSYEISTLFSNFSYLCKGIPPNTLRPLLTNSLNLTYQKAVKNNQEAEKAFISLIEYLKNTLLDKNIHEANRTLIGQIVELFTEQLNANDKLFDSFIPCIIESPITCIERISSPSLWWETTNEKFEQAVKVRCALLKNEIKKPFLDLNECICTAAILPGVQIYTLKNILTVFRFHAEHELISDWILELMGQIQEKLTIESKNIDEILFLCDVFLLAVIVFSGYDYLYFPTDMVAVTKEARLNLFPNAVFHLINEKCPHIASQMMEWLYHMVETSEFPSIYQMTFYYSLTALRHEKAFYDSSKWMKYISVKRPKY